MKYVEGRTDGGWYFTSNNSEKRVTAVLINLLRFSEIVVFTLTPFPSSFSPSPSWGSIVLPYNRAHSLSSLSLASEPRNRTPPLPLYLLSLNRWPPLSPLTLFLLYLTRRTAPSPLFLLYMVVKNQGVLQKCVGGAHPTATRLSSGNISILTQ